MHEFATRRGWTIIATVEEIASGAKDRRPSAPSTAHGRQATEAGCHPRVETGPLGTPSSI